MQYVYKILQLNKGSQSICHDQQQYKLYDKYIDEV